MIDSLEDYADNKICTFLFFIVVYIFCLVHFVCLQSVRRLNTAHYKKKESSNMLDSLRVYTTWNFTVFA